MAIRPPASALWQDTVERAAMAKAGILTIAVLLRTRTRQARSSDVVSYHANVQLPGHLLIKIYYACMPRGARKQQTLIWGVKINLVKVILSLCYIT